jgi:hypothetical protein
MGRRPDRQRSAVSPDQRIFRNATFAKKRAKTVPNHPDRVDPVEKTLAASACEKRTRSLRKSLYLSILYADIRYSQGWRAAVSSCIPRLTIGEQNEITHHL